MISKNKIKLIKSLNIKKHRQELGLFLAEGNKLVSDIMPFFECELIFAKPSWLNLQTVVNAKEVIIADEGEIEKTSLLKNPQDVIAVFVRPSMLLNKEELRDQLTLLLDGIQDPGNLGTIIRIADWFGIKNIICSPDTVDVFNPKTIQATMGSIGRVNVFYQPFSDLLSELKEIPVYGTSLDGKNIYEQKLHSAAFIVMGNEGNGIRRDVEEYITEKLFIPNYPLQMGKSIDSLNVAIATAVTCAEFRRQQIYPIKNI